MENSQVQYNTEQQGMQGVSFKIDPEFQNKIPPIGADEFKQLRENILAAGEVYEPLVVWNGILVDGHNRWKVIQERPEIKWSVREMHFDDKWAAFEWMYKNQLGRRNLTDEQRTYTIGKMYEARKKSVGEHKGNQYTEMESGQNVHIPTPYEVKQGTAGQIGKELSIDGRTVRRAEHFAKGVDALREVSPEAADKVLTGKSNIPKYGVADIANMEPAEVAGVAEAIISGKPEVKAPEKPKKPRNPNSYVGFTHADRELKATIDNSIASATGAVESQAFDVDDLLEEIRVNGESYIRGLTTTLSIRTDILKDDDAKKRVSVEISNIIQNIVKVRGEYVR